MNDLPSAQVLAIPEILCMIISYFDSPTLKTSSLVCKTWNQLAASLLWRQLVIPKDWYLQDLTNLLPALDRRGDALRALSLELSPSTRMVIEVDMDLIQRQLSGLLSRAPHLERLAIQVPREIKSTFLQTIATYSPRLKHFESDILNWQPSDMGILLAACPLLNQIAGHNFTGDVLQIIAQTQPSLSRIECTHPRFDDEELIEFAQQFPDLVQLSVSLHQFLTSKALIGVAKHCCKLEHLNFHFCLNLQSNGFQAILRASSNLRFLDMGLTEVQDADIALVAAQCPRLESLCLPFCSNITNASVQAIVSTCQSLRHLDLSWCDKVLLSVFDMHQPWICTKLQHLDISGIHASYSVETSVASTLLPSMYHQIGLLTELEYLKMSGHGFSLHLLSMGRSALSKLTKLETLDISKPRRPLPWMDMIEIGNLFPKLRDFQFRSSDVIAPPPLSPLPRSPTPRGPTLSRTASSLGSSPHDGVAIMTATSSENQSPLAPASPLLSSTPLSPSAPTALSPITFSTSLPAAPPPMTPLPAAVAEAGSGSPSSPLEEVRTKSCELESTAEEIMRATLKSGLEISFRLNGQDEDGEQDVLEEGFGFPGGMPF